MSSISYRRIHYCNIPSWTLAENIFDLVQFLVLEMILVSEQFLHLTTSKNWPEFLRTTSETYLKVLSSFSFSNTQPPNRIRFCDSKQLVLWSLLYSPYYMGQGDDQDISAENVILIQFKILKKNSTTCSMWHATKFLSFTLKLLHQSKRRNFNVDQNDFLDNWKTVKISLWPASWTNWSGSKYKPCRTAEQGYYNFFHKFCFIRLRFMAHTIRTNIKDLKF